MIQDAVKEYYGETLQGSVDLKTDACATTSAPPRHVIDALAAVHPDVSARYYGCGFTIPTTLDGLNVLDLGCGAGRDVFALAKLVGPKGHVTGVDMTDEQLAVAARHEAWHAEQFGYDAPNTRFVKGYLEQLDDLDLEPGSFDLIVS
ncbi:MAG: methyltransferase domain-containing protein, partial [Pseudomonadota bacterium]